MTVLAQLLIAAALAATAVIYGTDVFAAIVLRPALAHVDDRTLASAAGYMHDYADRRLPVLGAIGLAATVLGTTVAALAGHPGAAAAGGAAVLAMAVWLLIYRTVSAPVNRQLTAAAHDGRIPGDARALQRQWDHVINARAALQTVAGLVSGPRAGPQALKSVPASVIPPMPGRAGASLSVPGLRRAFLTVGGGTCG